MKRRVVFYFVVGVAVFIFAVGFLLSQYVEYKQYRLMQEKAIEDCMEKTAGTNSTGFIAANARQKCIEKFSK